MYLKLIKKEVLYKKSGLKKIITLFGSNTLENFYNKTNPLPTIPKDRKEAFLKEYKVILQERIPEESITIALKDFEQRWFAGTADHMHILHHPFFFNNAILESLWANNNGYKTIHFFPFSNISLINSSEPRGFSYHLQQDKKHVFFISRGKSRSSVWNTSPFTKKSVSNALQTLNDIDEKIKKYIESYYKYTTCKLYIDQISLINFDLWRKLQAPVDLIYIDIETITSRLLKNTIHNNKESILFKIFYTPEGQRFFDVYFKNIQGAHGDEKGSFLFWYFEDKKRKKLLYKNGNIIKEDGSHFDFNIQNISNLLDTKEIMPTMAMCFMVVSFYYGVQCGGGFSQIDYLGEMKEAYKKILENFNETDEINFIKNIQTNVFRGEIGFIYDKNKKILSTSIDILKNLNNYTWTNFEKIYKKNTLAQAMNPMYPLLYKITNPSKKNKCIDCGNNQTNHKLAWISNTSSVITQPLDTFILGSFLGNIARIVIEYCTLPYLKVFELTRLISFSDDSSKALTRRSQVVWEEAKKRNIQMKQLVILGKPVEFYKATLPNKKTITFESIPNTTRGWKKSYGWMDDKLKLKKELYALNIPVPKGYSISSKEKLFTIIDKLDKPLITKPRLGSRGRHTSTFLYTPDQIRKGFSIAQKLCNFVIVEEHLMGSVYRGTCINGRLVGVLEGIPPRITGDGIHTIQELIQIKNRTKKEKIHEVKIDAKLIEFLSRNTYTLQSILPQNKTIDTSEKIGISYGGSSREIFDSIHPKIIYHLEKAARVLNAGVIGFDFIIPNPQQDPDNQKWGIIECNSLPFINLHHDPIEGSPINVAHEVWDEVEKLYIKK